MKAGFQYAYQYDVQTTGASGNARYTDFGFNPDPTIGVGSPVLVSPGLGCQMSYVGGRFIYDPNNASTFSQCNSVTRFYNQYGEAAPLTTHAYARTYGFFLQDRWTVNKQFTIIPGFRVDVGRLQGEQGLVTTPLIGFGPRLSGTFDLFGDRKTLIVAHAGRSNDVGNVAIAQHGNPALLGVTALWNNSGRATTSPDGTVIPANSFPNCPVSAAANQLGNRLDGRAYCTYAGGPAGRSFLPGQSPPYVDEVTGGIHHEVLAETVIGVDVTYRHYGNMWADQEVNRIWDPSGTKIIGYVNPALNGQSVLQAVAPASGYRRYTGMDLWVQGTPGRWDLLASYTLGFNTGTVGDYFDGYLNNPRMTMFYDGYTNDDHRHTVKGSISYRTTFGLDLGARVRYFTGGADWMSFTNPGDSSQRLYRSPRGTGVPAVTTGGSPNFNDPSTWSDLRDPAQFLIDLQARYNLSGPLGLKQQRAEVLLLVVNVLNDSSPTSIFDSFSATSNRFGLANFHQSPMQAEVMLRFRN
jgi:hypothetical protein